MIEHQDQTPTWCQFTWQVGLWPDQKVQCRLPFGHGGTFHLCGTHVTARAPVSVCIRHRDHIPADELPIRVALAGIRASIDTAFRTTDGTPAGPLAPLPTHRMPVWPPVQHPDCGRCQ
ncbi:hypothetical protein AWB91_09055 [Mycobacterium paraense]|uniref:Uncharacterized protein n=1 Tax=Mycobacterium paraense TaxID=767916 RepID=A0ABX3VS46_9MYCO|nr:hypothetical protein [Mycobacterium paraense]ORW33264.1 hypothetical protein AWB91_09055 [Mycobacterium paraense]ORW34675.1 hypothetical protein AWB88_02720 [Mycobacterium paraense]